MLRIVSVLLAVAEIGVLAACSSEQRSAGYLLPEAGATAAADAGAGAGAGGCNLIIEVPPVIAVVNAETGNPVCDPTFTIVAAPEAAPVPADGGNIGTLCTPEGAVYGGCWPGDASGACAYILNWIDDEGISEEYTVQVSKDGFESKIVPSVRGGVVYCGGGVTPASHLVVALSPNDGGAGPSDAGDD